MRRRHNGRWHTRFGNWVSQVTVSRIVAELGRSPDTAVDPHTVYQWIAGRRVPRPHRAQALAAFSKGQITVDDIYSHSRELHSRGSP